MSHEKILLSNDSEFAAPPEGFRAQLAWKIGNDAFSSKIVKQTGLNLTTEEEKLITDICQRKPGALAGVSLVIGRTASYLLPPVSCLGTDYNCRQISGIGYRPLGQINGSTAIANREISPQVRLPSSEDFGLTHPEIVGCAVIDRGEEIDIDEGFHFTGAYTKDQALKKVSTSLFILDHLLGTDSPPFLCPIPEAIGFYPEIRKEGKSDGEPAFFISWRVPYSGERTGYLTFNSQNRSQVMAEAIVRSRRVGNTIRYWHDVLGLTHNQAVPGNFFVPQDKKNPVFLADYETVYPLDMEEAAVARTYDIGKPIKSLVSVVELIYPRNRSLPEIKIKILFQFLTLYFGVGTEIEYQPGITDLREQLYLIIKAQTEKGTIPKIVPAADTNWAAIQKIKRNLSQSLQL